MKASQRSLLLLEQCLNMTQMKQIQSHLAVSGTLLDPYAAGRFVAFCAVHDFSYAHRFFQRLPRRCRTAYVCNTMIKALVDGKEHASALAMYKRMVRDSGFLPNNYTFSFLLTACAQLGDVCLGSSYHCQAIRLGWESYDFVQNGLIHVYVTCNVLESARRIFDASVNRDVITWTALINGYVKSDQVDVARNLFDEMPDKNAVSWSAMINGYVQAGQFGEALVLFNAMQNHSGLRPNHAGVVAALSACAFLGALDQGRWIHAYVDRTKMKLDRILGTALIDMYSKCGCVETARHVFEEMEERDVFAFTSLISCLANHGRSKDAVELFRRMLTEGVTPNEVTFICVLSACSRMGMADHGLEIFRSMSKEYGIEPGVQHYGCLVDLLGRVGMLEEAKQVVRGMPMEPDSYVLGALLNGCRVHGDVELGREMVESIIQRKLDHSGVHVLLSNIYASTSQWDDVVKVRKGMEENRVKKVPGCSSIEVNGEVREFVVGSQSVALVEEVVPLLCWIEKHLKSLRLEEEGEAGVADNCFI
ncbi:uncharacterized protein J3R85_014414 [Psidium guajava]|nr:uncharacterized protein J3R85_014414 [Psidium guajava]